MDKVAGYIPGESTVSCDARGNSRIANTSSGGVAILRSACLVKADMIARAK